MRHNLSAEAHAARRWMMVAVAVLVVAGVFALLLVVGRMPGLDVLVTDPLWFKRVLVVHVNLALVCWFYSFVAALLFLLPGRDRSSLTSRWSPWLATLGVSVMAVAAWLAWRHAEGAARRRAMAVFGAQLGLNMAWSGLFFGLRRPELAAIEIVVLLVAILATIAVFRPISRPAAWLLAPYAGWVTFATVLNVTIWQMN